LEKKQKLFQSVIDSENRYRELFAQERNNKLISDPHVGLLSVFDNEDQFNFVKLTPKEKKLPTMFPIPEEERDGRIGEKSIVSKNEFKTNWSVFTEGKYFVEKKKERMNEKF